MATLADLMALIPEGDEYNELRGALSQINELFPGEMSEITTSRLEGWIDEVDSGTGRDADEIRDNMFQHIVGADVIQQVLGVTPEQAQALILGGNEGGMNFSDLNFDADGNLINEDDVSDGDLPITEGPPGEEDQNDEGIGGGGEDEETALTILTSEEMEWFFDEGSGKWYVSYGLPESDRRLLFEADPDQMDSLFGEGFRPSNYSRRSIEGLLGDDNIIWGENIAAMSGTGAFEDEVRRVQAIALDSGSLPEWASQTGEIMDLVYIAQSQGKTQDWLYEQIATTSDFQARFPGLESFRTQGNLTLVESITGFLEFEAGIRGAVTAIGGDIGRVTPEVVSGLLNKGFDLKTVSTAVARFDRMEKFKPAMDAFNRILVEQGHEQIESLQDQFDFLSGAAPAEVYDIWEASSVAEAAAGAGLGDIFTAEDAMQFAIATEGQTSLQDATGMFSEAASMLLRLRHEVEVDKFGISTDDLIDLSLKQAPRSGTSAAELTENINRAILSAQGNLKQRSRPFTGFTSSGTPQRASLGGLRESS